MKRSLNILAMLSLFAAMSAVQAGGDAQAGKAKAASCAGCHGANGEGRSPNPAIAGKPEGPFVEAMEQYKSGKRTNPVMMGLASKLSEQDIANLAAYYASLKGK